MAKPLSSLKAQPKHQMSLGATDPSIRRAMQNLTDPQYLTGSGLHVDPEGRLSLKLGKGLKVNPSTGNIELDLPPVATEIVQVTKNQTVNIIEQTIQGGGAMVESPTGFADYFLKKPWGPWDWPGFNQTGGAIIRGDCLMFDYRNISADVTEWPATLGGGSGSAFKAFTTPNTNTTFYGTFGIALHDAGDGDPVTVRVRGVVEAFANSAESPGEPWGPGSGSTQLDSSISEAQQRYIAMNLETTTNSPTIRYKFLFSGVDKSLGNREL